MKLSDEQLISDYLDGDEKAISVLVGRYLTDVYNFSLKLTGDKQAAEDISQNSFVKAWKNIRKFEGRSKFRTWLFTVARNSAIDWLRERKELPVSAFEINKGENMLLNTLVDDNPLPDELLAKAEDTQFVQMLLSELNPLYRDVLSLRYEKSLTYEEIGKILKRPLHTVKSQHRRALIALRRSLETRPI